MGQLSLSGSPKSSLFFSFATERKWIFLLHHLGLFWKPSSRSSSDGGMTGSCLGVIIYGSGSDSPPCSVPHWRPSTLGSWAAFVKYCWCTHWHLQMLIRANCLILFVLKPFSVQRKEGWAVSLQEELACLPLLMQKVEAVGKLILYWCSMLREVCAGLDWAPVARETAAPLK